MKAASQSPDVETGRYLDISTGHLRHSTCDELDQFDGVLAYRTSHGWFLYAPEAAVADLDEEATWPNELRVIVQLARNHDCGYVLFDADGPIYDHLPTWDW